MRFRSPLLSQSMFLSFPPGTEMVHFPGFARARLWIHRAVRRVHLRGFPHSEIPGSMPACGSPRLIAACHVLHRLLLPRHPPCALSSLTIKFTQHTRSVRSPSFDGSLASRLRLANLMGLIPAHRTKTAFSSQLSAIRISSDNQRPRAGDRLVHQQANSGTHKIFTRLVICPIYSVVKYRPREIAVSS